MRTSLLENSLLAGAGYFFCSAVAHNLVDHTPPAVFSLTDEKIIGRMNESLQR